MRDGDFHWTNFGGPDLTTVDWEGWGQAPVAFDVIEVEDNAGGGLRKPGLARTHTLVLAKEPGPGDGPCRAPVAAAASGCGRRTVEVPRA